MQYFPSLEYLLKVLDGAVQRIRDEGGQIILGDVRNLDLSFFFYAKKILYGKSDDCTASQWLQHSKFGVEVERELLISPEFFVVYAQRVKQLYGIDIIVEPQLRTGKKSNELTEFRFDVVMHVAKSHKMEKVIWNEWDVVSDSESAVKQTLLECMKECAVSNQMIGLKGIPYKRLAKISRTIEFAEQNPQTRLLELYEYYRNEELRGSKSSDPTDAAVNPEAIVAMVESVVGVEAKFLVSRKDKSLFDVVFHRPESRLAPSCSWEYLHGPAEKDLSEEQWTESLRSLVSNPRDYISRRNFARQLHVALEKSLVVWERPSTVTVVKSLPQTTRGKIDEDRLPPPMFSKGVVDYAPPRPGTHDAMLVDIWAKVLNIDPDQIGIWHRFTDNLGGGSALMIETFSLLEKELGGKKIPFPKDAETIFELSNFIAKHVGRFQPPQQTVARRMSGANVANLEAMVEINEVSRYEDEETVELTLG